MAARPVPRRPAGVEDRRALRLGQAGEFKLLEGADGHGRDVLPVRDRPGRESARFAELSINWVPIELKGEQLQGQPTEAFFHPWFALGRLVRPSLCHELAQTGSISKKGWSDRHAVLWQRIAGWLSATAGEEVFYPLTQKPASLVARSPARSGAE